MTTGTDPETQADAPKKKGWSIWTWLIVGALFALLVCGGIGAGGYYAFFASPPAPVATEATGPAACSPPTGVELTSFDADGALRWTADSIGPGEDRTMTILVCDGPALRAIRVTGFTPGEDGNWQDGAMTDGGRRVVYQSDLVTTSVNPVRASRLEGVTIQCLPELGSCQPAAPITPGT